MTDPTRRPSDIRQLPDGQWQYHDQQGDPVGPTHRSREAAEKWVRDQPVANDDSSKQ